MFLNRRLVGFLVAMTCVVGLGRLVMIIDQSRMTPTGSAVVTHFIATPHDAAISFIIGQGQWGYALFPSLETIQVEEANGQAQQIAIRLASVDYGEKAWKAVKRWVG